VVLENWRRSYEPSDNGFSASDSLPLGNFDPGVRRQIEIRPRSKHNQSKPRTPRQNIVFLGMADDSPRKHSGDLYNLDFSPLIIPQLQAVVLISL